MSGEGSIPAVAHEWPLTTTRRRSPDPGVVLTGGVVGNRVLERTQALLGAGAPPCFQFRHLWDDTGAPTAATALDAYVLASSLGSRTPEKAPAVTRIETFIVVPLVPRFCEATITQAREVRDLPEPTVPGVNAIFITSTRLLRLPSEDIKESVRIIDTAMEGPAPPFNRCFFVDDLGERGQRLPTFDDLVEVVARYLALALWSELSTVLRDVPAPYIGTGEHRQAYASFFVSRVLFDAEYLAGIVARQMASALKPRLFLADGPRPSDARRQEPDNFARSLEAPTNQAAAVDPGSGSVILERGNRLAPRDLASGPVFVAAATRFDEYCRATIRELNLDLGRYRAILVEVLDRGLVALERVKMDIAAIRAEIADLQVKLIAEISEPSEPPRRAHGSPPFSWREPLLVAGIGLLLLSLAFAWATAHPIALMGIFAALVLAVVSFFLPKSVPEPRLPPPPPAVSWTQLLAAKRRALLARQQVLDAHVPIYVILDLAVAGLDDMNRATLDDPDRPSWSVCDVDLLDDRALATILQDIDDSALSDFPRPDEIDGLNRAVLGYPDTNPAEELVQCCRRRADVVMRVGLEEISFRRARTSGGIGFPPPLWYPADTNERESTLLATLPPGNTESLRTLLKEAFSGQPIRFIPGESRTRIDVVQISHGVTLADLIFDVPGT